MAVHYEQYEKRKKNKLACQQGLGSDAEKNTSYVNTSLQYEHYINDHLGH